MICVKGLAFEYNYGNKLINSPALIELFVIL